MDVFITVVSCDAFAYKHPNSVATALRANGFGRVRSVIVLDSSTGLISQYQEDTNR